MNLHLKVEPASVAQNLKGGEVSVRLALFGRFLIFVFGAPVPEPLVHGVSAMGDELLRGFGFPIAKSAALLLVFIGCVEQGSNSRA